jgi:hypothetical protein
VTLARIAQLPVVARFFRLDVFLGLFRGLGPEGGCTSAGLANGGPVLPK